MIIGYVNRIDACILIGSAAGSSGLPAANIQGNPIARPYRVTGSTLNIDFDYGAATVWAAFALLGTNLTPTATVRITLSAVAPGNGDVYDTEMVSAGVKPGYAQVYHVMAAALTARYGRITVSDSNLAWIDIGRVFAGPVWRPTFGESYGRGIWWEDASAHLRTIGGQVLSTDGARYRIAEFQVDHNTETEMMTNAFEVDRLRGTGGDILVMLDPITYVQELSIWGPLMRATSLQHWAPGRVRKRYRIEERL